MVTPEWRVAMKVKTLLLTGAVSVGVAVGAIGYAFHGGAQTPVTVVDLVKRNLASGGNEGSIFLVELAPGAAVGRHYHPGDAFAYILEGSMVLELDGQPPVTLKPGDSGHVLPRQVHDDKNASSSKPVKFLVFHVTEKGQPLAVPVR
jgi:quercetin dioxygenase-like cupin family protein